MGKHNGEPIPKLALACKPVYSAKKRSKESWIEFNLKVTDLQLSNHCPILVLSLTGLSAWILGIADLEKMPQALIV
ncbi:hypothetical protein MITS9504_02987 [Synechococcus sp. MIT S9504]|nr:hypothetical protein MITS9504_02987 [Synechococcus sp. MIT S9504]